MSKYNVRYLASNEHDLWNEFVDEEKDGILFQRTDWMKAIFRQQDPSIDCRVLACFNNKNGKLVGGIAFGVKKKLGIWIMVQPHNTPFSGLLISHRKSTYPSKDQSFRFEIMSLIAQKMEGDLNFISILTPLEIKDIRPFIWRNYKTSTLYTFYARDLNPQEAINSFNPDVRRQATKATKLPLSIKQGHEAKLINDFFHLQELTFKRQNHNFKFNNHAFERLINELVSSVNVTFYVAYFEGSPIAGQVVLYYKKKAYYWLAASHPDYLKSGANQALLTFIIEDFNTRKINNFDFVGANTPGVADYKASFNFPLVNYYHLNKIIGSYAKVLFFLKELVKH